MKELSFEEGRLIENFAKEHGFIENEYNAIFLKAAAIQNKAIMSLLLTKGNIILKNKVVAFQDAAIYGHTEIVELLLKEEDINIEEKGRVLIVVAGIGNEEIVSLLLEVPDMTKEYVSQALGNASHFGKKHIENLLSDFEDYKEKNKRKIKEFLKEHGIDEYDYGSCLQIAAEKGNDEIVRLVLEDKNVEIYHKSSSLRHAAKNGHKEVVELLLKDPESSVNIDGLGVHNISNNNPNNSSEKSKNPKMNLKQKFRTAGFVFTAIFALGGLAAAGALFGLSILSIIPAIGIVLGGIALAGAILLTTVGLTKSTKPNNSITPEDTLPSVSPSQAPGQIKVVEPVL